MTDPRAESERDGGDAAAELMALVSSGIVRLLDLTLLHKAEDGSIEVEEIEDLTSVDQLVERRPARRLRTHSVAGADRLDDQRRSMTMPIGIGRVGRVGMIGRPVARTAAVVGTAKVVSNGVDRRQERRQDRRDRRF